MDSAGRNKITISTHNVNGYKGSKEFLHSLCESEPNSIRGIQEHWLRPPYKKQFGVNQLRCLHPNFDGFGTSAMKTSLETKVNVGRPFGGTGFLYNKKYAKCLKPILNYSQDRVTVMELNTDTHRILIINAYMPYFNSRDISTYLNMYKETIGHIDNIMHQNAGSQFIFLADLNCNIYDSRHCYSALVRQLMSKHRLVSSFDLMPNFDSGSTYTRFDKKQNSYTLIDGILLSNELVPLVDNIRVSHYGNNVSDHLPVELDLHVSVTESYVGKRKTLPYVNWKKLSQESLELFKQKMTVNLDSINAHCTDIHHGNKLCSVDSHKASLENYYNDIVNAVLNAQNCLPRTDNNVQRSFWTDELSDLKRASINCTNFWKSQGSPTSGPVYDCKKNCCMKYKTAIRRSKKENEKHRNDHMYSDLLNHDTNSFWKSWNSLNRVGDSIVSRIDGETEEGNIANAFASYFQSVYSGHDSPEHELLKDDFYDTFSKYYSEHSDDDISGYYLSWTEMIDIAAKIKVGKATAGVIRPEHFIYGSASLLRHFQNLFNGMIQHGFVPTEFLRGTISPIVKDSQGDVSDPANYRGITLSCLPAKLFEFAIQTKTVRLLGTDFLQFGFKRKTSTSHALYTLRSTIDYFVKNGSKVYVAFLDCTKAFDRISHYGLFKKLIDRKIPLCLLLCLMFWYENMVSVVKWGSEISREFRVPLGVKQGGINSPDFFSIYFDGLCKLLRSLKIGCHIGSLYLASILFADDICLLAPTRSALQRMINCCSSYCKRYALDFNPKKSKIMVFSKSVMNLDTVKSVQLNGKEIELVKEIRYLGTTITSNPGFEFSALHDLQSFYRASNSILNVLNGPEVTVQMQLLYTNCVPTLTYACAVKEFPPSEMTNCNTALNDAIRKIFSYQRWESVRYLREGCGYKSLTELFASAKQKFQESLSSNHNTVVSRLFRINQKEQQSNTTV